MMDSLAFPPLARRLRAAIADGTIVAVAIWLSLWLGDSLGFSSGAGKALLFAIPIFVLEPFLVSITGSSLGHFIMGLKVTKRDGKSHIGLPAALVRFVVRLLLGVLSFVFVLTTQKRQAVHDLLVGSVVVYRNPSLVHAGEIIAENRLDHENYRYPRWWLRVIVAFLYVVGLLLLLFFAAEATISEDCIQTRFCSPLDTGISLAIDTGFWALVFAVIALAWKGRLFGCRRKKITKQP